MNIKYQKVLPDEVKVLSVSGRQSDLFCIHLKNIPKIVNYLKYMVHMSCNLASIGFPCLRSSAISLGNIPIKCKVNIPVANIALNTFKTLAKLLENS